MMKMTISIQQDGDTHRRIMDYEFSDDQAPEILQMLGPFTLRADKMLSYHHKIVKTRHIE